MAQLDLSIKRHGAFFNRCLQVLPSAYTPTDGSRLALLFFCVSALDILGLLPFDSDDTPRRVPAIVTHEQTERWRAWIIDTCLLPTKNAFRCSPSLTLPTTASYTPTTVHDAVLDYDPGHAAGTYFALATLLILGDDLSAIDRPAMMRWLSECQRDDGSFATGVMGYRSDMPGEEVPDYVKHFGERDLRFGYCVAASRWMIGGDLLQCSEDVNITSAIEYIRSCVTFDGGIGIGKLTESHGGLTYCGVGTLNLLLGDDGSSNGAALYEVLGEDAAQKMLRWTLEHQVLYVDDSDSENEDDDDDESEDGTLKKCFAGFNGRTNKACDTCYSFWLGGTLAMIPPSSPTSPSSLTSSATRSLALSDISRNSAFLLGKTQNMTIGGFAKAPGAMPDVLHSYLGLCSLSMGAAVAREQGLLVGDAEDDDIGILKAIAPLQALDPVLCISSRARRHGEILRAKWSTP
ncbi:terpenoid cyclases/protein prenyltransferase alpha-alpha toroid [Limtongia smithiae]|uniref:terpenoid cyclases/protein prenyltransferase alpha-alpha toroid n=1 Tax=Limtongia smithiae TaxID=1125753 RepID=UPI0034CD0D16